MCDGILLDKNVCVFFCVWLRWDEINAARNKLQICFNKDSSMRLFVSFCFRIEIDAWIFLFTFQRDFNQFWMWNKSDGKYSNYMWRDVHHPLDHQEFQTKGSFDLITFVSTHYSSLFLFEAHGISLAGPIFASKWDRFRTALHVNIRSDCRCYCQIGLITNSKPNIK